MSMPVEFIAPTMNTAVPIMQLKGIEKSFGALRAVDGVDFSIYPGEVQALVGDNGAGKSTLVKTIAGAHQPDPVRFCSKASPFILLSPLERFNVSYTPWVRPTASEPVV